MTETVTIPRQRNPQAGEDFAALRETGMDYIRKLAGKIWTDHNIHDPGITTLELLCYAITDLSYRTGFDMKDLLSFSPDDLLADNKSFHTALSILPNNPTTLNDLRRIVVDIDGVQNAWIDVVEGCHPDIFLDCENETLTLTNPGSDAPGPDKNIDKKFEDLNPGGPFDPRISKSRFYVPRNPNRSLSAIPQLHIKGMYQIHVLFEEHILKNGFLHAGMIRRVRERIHKYRNLCEDLCGIDLIQYEDIGICIEIEVIPEADINLVLATIWFRIDQFLNPPVKYYSLDELLDAGKSPEDIFEGPVLEHGFIDEEELEQSQRTEFIYTSDLYNIIMDLPEVISVKKLEITNFDLDNKPLDGPEKWCLPLSDPARKVPKLSYAKSGITFFKGELPYFPNQSRFEQNLRNLMAEHLNSKVGLPDQDLKIPEGNYQDLQDYAPFTNDFPLVYGIGPDGLPLNAGTERQSRSKQFKGFLLFMEQILANYLSQLSNVRELFTWTEADEIAGVVPTYYSQVLKEVQGIEELYFDYDRLGEKLGGLLETEEERLDRRNRFLDHLLARFAEEMTEYGLILFSKRLSESPESALEAKEEILRDKARYLRDYPVLSRDRGKGFDMMKINESLSPLYEMWDTEDNITGYQKRIARSLGMDFMGRRDLAIFDFSIEPVLVEEPPLSNIFITRWVYRVRFEVTVAAVQHLHDLQSEQQYESQYEAERAFEQHLPWYSDAAWVPDPDANPNVDSKWAFRLETEVKDNTVILARSGLFDSEEYRDKMMYAANWYFIAKVDCLPLRVDTDVYADGGGQWTFALGYTVPPEISGTTVILQAPQTWTTGDEAFEAMRHLLSEIGTNHLSIPFSFTPSTDTEFAFEVRDADDNLLATSNSFTNENERDQVLNYGPRHFQTHEHCDARGVHVIEHLLLRPRRSHRLPERLLPACVHCPPRQTGSTSGNDVIVSKMITTETEGRPTGGRPGDPPLLTIAELKLEDEVVTISTRSEIALDLTDYALWSMEGLQVFRFPEGYLLPAGGTVKIVSGKDADQIANGNDILFWTNQYVWRNEGDQVFLLSPYRKIISFFPPSARDETQQPLNVRGVFIQRLDLENESVRVVNESGADIKMKGWYLESLTAFQLFAFPDNFVLKNGNSVRIVSGENANPNDNSPDQLFWTNRHVWLNEDDQAVLISPSGKVAQSNPEQEPQSDSLYYVKVETAERELLLLSELFPIRNERDIRHLELFEFGADFNNYAIFEPESHRFHLKVGPESDSRILLSAPEAYFKTEDEALADIELLADYFYAFVNPPESDSSSSGENPDNCHYENDPYSFKLTVLLPGWVDEFGDPDFRRFAERKIRMETPAHLWPKICWIGRWQMRQFENRWREWLLVNADFLSGEPVNRLRMTYHGVKPIELAIYRDDGLSEPLMSATTVQPKDLLLVEAAGLSPGFMNEHIYLVIDPGSEQMVRKLNTSFTGTRDGDFEVLNTHPHVSSSEITLKFHGTTAVKAEFFNDASLTESIAVFESVGQYDQLVINANGLADRRFSETLYLVIDDDPGSSISFSSTQTTTSPGDFQIMQIVPFYTFQLKELVDMMGEFRNVYPVGSKLHDCEGEGDDSKIILGNSTLGNF